MEYLTTTEMAEKWGISRRRIATLCKEQRIEETIFRKNMADSERHGKARGCEKAPESPKGIAEAWAFIIDLRNLWGCF